MVGACIRLSANQTFDLLIDAFIARFGVGGLANQTFGGWLNVDRVEFLGILAVHFVVYGVLGRGVSGSARDCVVTKFNQLTHGLA
ncbi:uncharacterized protein BDR25DRAFT_350341 [Lindgomyces ingoldianus]|uniref:Uncharacterized protein n=1 Tax=Lindgomyces ingoldianus TaxID=673940 RepID=A0ACB6RA58_9PLEO|nr:uncharacterized protein BDR25DRAFT_350341 [Lindgomyces ingoldianus]KAF2476071.1 hypothetical protein BDR25DRAFT_350341 [Lindgomyces ingoldianus]